MSRRQSDDGGNTPETNKAPEQGLLPNIERKRKKSVKVKVLQKRVHLKPGILVRDANKRIKNPGDVLVEALA